MAELSLTALTDPILMNEGKSIPPLLWFIILGGLSRDGAQTYPPRPRFRHCHRVRPSKT